MTCTISAKSEIIIHSYLSSDYEYSVQRTFNISEEFKSDNGYSQAISGRWLDYWIIRTILFLTNSNFRRTYVYIPPDRAQNSQTSKLVDLESDVTWPKFQYVRRKWIDKAVGGMNRKRCLFHCLRGFAVGFESFLERNVTIGTRSERKRTKILESTNFVLVQ